MKLLRSMLLNALTVFGCAAAGRETVTGPVTVGFQLAVVARESGPGVVSRAVSGSSASILVQSSAVLSSAELSAAKAVTKSAWYVLSGSHSTSTLVLSIKPAAVARFQADVRRAIGGGDPLALVVNDEVVGRLMLWQTPAGDELAIDASFFSQGTEKQKASDTRMLAKQIQATLF